MPVANAESARKSQVREGSASGLTHFPLSATKAASSTNMMPVLLNVARSESTPWIPILAKIAVSAAKIADNRAQNSHPEVVDIRRSRSCNAAVRLPHSAAVGLRPPRAARHHDWLLPSHRARVARTIQQ